MERAQLFHGKNCNTMAVFGQKLAAWLKGKKKNYAQLTFRGTAERTSNYKHFRLLGALFRGVLGVLGLSVAFWSDRSWA